MNQALNNLKVGDKVRVLRNSDPNKNNWSTNYYGIVTKLGTRGFVKVWEPKRRDGNTGLPEESCEWTNVDSKMTRVVKGE